VIALDTNILARLLLQDDAAQHARAKQLLAQARDYTAPVTVMLELVWVLEANDCSPADIVRGLTLLLGLPNFKPQQAEALHRALENYLKGFDFADALHLALSGAAEQFVTFDRGFVKKAAKHGAEPQVVAP
jgi:predicted nucleic-acid-binding protein